MKNIFIFSVFVFFSQFSFSQSFCSIGDIQKVVEKASKMSKKEVKVNETRYEKALLELAKMKNWDLKQKEDFAAEVTNSKEYLASAEMEKKLFAEFSTMLTESDKSTATEGNCEIMKKIEEKLNQVIKQNNTGWKIMTEKIATEYKVVTKKELVIE